MSNGPVIGSEKSYTFGPFLLDLRQRLLFKEGKLVPLAPKPLHILCILVENHGKLVEYEELMRLVWPNVFVEEGNLKVHVFALRHVLAEGLDEAGTIESIPRRGYRFAALVEEVPAPSEVISPDEGEPEKEQQESNMGRASGDASEMPHGFSRHSQTRLFRPSVLAVAAVVAVALGLTGWLAMSAPPMPRVEAVRQLTHFGLASRVVTDGTRLYVMERKAGGSSIVQVPIGGGEPAPIVTPFQDTRLLDVSSRNHDLLIAGFDNWSDPWQVWILPLGDGTPRQLGNVVSDSARWSPDGTKIAFEDDKGELCTVNADGSNVKTIVKDGGKVDAWSPDGQRIRFTRLNPATGGTSLWEVDADGTHLRLLFPELQNPNATWGGGQNLGRWPRSGSYFLFHGAAGLYAVPQARGFFSLHKPEPVQIYMPDYAVDDVALSPDGRQAFLVGRNERRELVRYDRSLRQFVPFLSDMPIASISWSPDGKTMAYTTTTGAGLWRARSDGTGRVRLTEPPLEAFEPVWSPDGRSLAFHVLVPGKAGKISVLPAEGGTPIELLQGQPTAEDGPNWSPDGKELMFGRNWIDKEGRSSATAICIFDMTTGKLSNLPGSQGLGSPSWSPNGRYVVASSGDLSRLMLYDFHTEKWTQIASGGTINSGFWSRDGKSFYFQDVEGGNDQPIYRYSLSTGKLKEVASRKSILSPDVSRYLLKGLTPDGDLVAVEIQDDADIYALDLKLH